MTSILSRSTGRLRWAVPILNYAKVNNKGFQSLKIKKVHSKLKQMGKGSVSASPSSGVWHVESMSDTQCTPVHSYLNVSIVETVDASRDVVDASPVGGNTSTVEHDHDNGHVKDKKT